MSTIEKPDFWQLIEQAPEQLRGVATLVRYSTNYEIEKGTPFLVFLDLIGYSQDNYGENQVKEPWRVLDYLAISCLADALQEYATTPIQASDYIDELLSADR
jgi:hypothetical protein